VPALGLALQPAHQTGCTVQKRPGIPQVRRRDGIADALSLETVEILEIAAERGKRFENKTFVKLSHLPPPPTQRS
jgi:hypothetical protein